MALWWPRFLRIAVWFIETERDRRASASPLATEAQGTLSIALPGGPFTIDARADRIDRLKSGGLAIIDYKTGQAPSGKQVAAGIAPQLPLEALMATAGTFKGVDAAPVEELSYWRLSGREPAGKITRIKEDPTVLATRVYAMISALLRKFDDPKTPYRATPRPGLLKNRKYRNDYEHLARNAEWSVSGSAEDD
jgi:ATP-dependent helicase/nuclease subunit B